MSTTPYQQLAKEFLDLWQKQVASVVSDKQFIQSMLEMIETMQMPNVNAAQPSHPADAPGAEPHVDAQLAYRLAMCERRIAALEKAAQGKAKSQKTAKPAAKRSKKSPK